MAVRQTSRSYKDISLSFEPNPMTGDLSIIKNESAIKRSVRNLVQTNLTERFFNPTLGCDVRSNLFDFVDIGSASIIRRKIELVLQSNEPRVENVQVNVDPLIDENAFNVTIFFDIVGQDFPLQQFSFLLEATR